MNVKWGSCKAHFSVRERFKINRPEHEMMDEKIKKKGKIPLWGFSDVSVSSSPD